MPVEPAATPRLTLADIRAARALLGGRVLRTPVMPLEGPAVEAVLAPETRVLLKLELFQHTGSFKPRGVLNRFSLQLADRQLVLDLEPVSGRSDRLRSRSCRRGP